MNRSSYYLLLTILICLCSIPLVIQSDTGADNIVIKTTDLTQLGASSIQSNRPILLLMSQEDCPYCMLIKQEVLNPMIISGDYDNKVIIREFVIDLHAEVRSFNGKGMDASDIADGYKVKNTPTLLFLGPDGEELTKRITGINTLEMFSFYLDKAIDIAVAKLKTE